MNVMDTNKSSSGFSIFKSVKGPGTENWRTDALGYTFYPLKQNKMCFSPENKNLSTYEFQGHCLKHLF